MYVILLNGPDEGKQLNIQPGTYKIGRSTTNDIIINEDQYVSGLHAEIKLTENGKLTITDEKSRNGTYLLGEIVESQSKVNPGDIIRVGHTFLKVSRRSMERFFASELEEINNQEAIMVIDLVGSSKIAQAMGDRMASKIKTILFDTIDSLLKVYPVEYKKSTGDGAMLIFTSPMDAVKFAVDYMNSLSGDGSYRGFHIRIGIHFGETMKLEDNDRRGMNVDMAFRIESVKIDNMHQTVVGIRKDDLPRVDRIFISEVVYRRIPAHSSLKTRCIGFFDLKGFNGRHKVFEVLY